MGCHANAYCLFAKPFNYSTHPIIGLFHKNIHFIW